MKVGEDIEIVGFRDTRKTVVTGIEMFNKQLDDGMAGRQRRSFAARHAKEDVERGMVLAKPGSINPHTEFKAEVYVLTKEEGGRHTPFFKGYQPQFYFRTTDVTGSGDVAGGHGNGYAGRQRGLEIESITPVAMEKGLRFAIREGGRTGGRRHHHRDYCVSFFWVRRSAAPFPKPRQRPQGDEPQKKIFER